VTGAERTEARGLIDRSGGSVRTAIVMQQRGFSREEAERALRDAGGVVRRVLPHAPPPVE